MKQELEGLLAEFEPLVGYKSVVARGLIDGNEFPLAFEQIARIAIDESFELTADSLGKLTQIAKRLGYEEVASELVAIEAGSKLRPWMDVQPPERPPEVRPQADWWQAASGLGAARSWDKIVPTLRLLVSREPVTIELIRFVRMIAPSAPSAKASEIALLLSEGDLLVASAMLDDVVSL